MMYKCHEEKNILIQLIQVQKIITDVIIPVAPMRPPWPLPDAQLRHVATVTVILVLGEQSGPGPDHVEAQFRLLN